MRKIQVLINGMNTMTQSEQRFEKAITLIDAANREDPNFEVVEGKKIPKELLYGQRMSDMINRFLPDADDVAKLSVRAQHIQRWKSPRSDYPMNRKGYHLWRTKLYSFHANTAAQLLEKAGYDQESIQRIKMAIAKKKLKSNPDTQVIEDIAALTFIEHYMTAMYTNFPQYDETKWIDIIQRTWRKMSAKAHDFVLSGKLKLPEPFVPLIQKALA